MSGGGAGSNTYSLSSSDLCDCECCGLPFACLFLWRGFWPGPFALRLSLTGSLSDRLCSMDLDMWSCRATAVMAIFPFSDLELLHWNKKRVSQFNTKLSTSCSSLQYWNNTIQMSTNFMISLHIFFPRWNVSIEHHQRRLLSHELKTCQWNDAHSLCINVYKQTQRRTERETKLGERGIIFRL